MNIPLSNVGAFRWDEVAGLAMLPKNYAAPAWVALGA